MHRPERPRLTDVEKIARLESEVAEWRAKFEAIEAAQSRLLGWLKTQAFMFECVALDIERRGVTSSEEN